MILRKQDHPQPANEEYRTVELTRGQFALVDAEDFERLSKFNWQAQWSKDTQSFYARRRMGIRMEKEILNVPDGFVVDHRSRNTLDNRKKNLRRANQTQNRQNASQRRDNTSGYRGITLHRSTGKWEAKISVNGTRKYLGVFESPELAAGAYQEASKKLHGEFSPFHS